MTRYTTLSPIIVAAFLLAATRPAAAQGIARGYQPGTPTLSPWLNLYQRNQGPIDPYNQFVRPELNLRETLRQQDLTAQRQGADVSALGQQMTQMEADRLNPLRPTGTASVFMNYSHYYPMRGAGGVGQVRPRTARPAQSQAMPQAMPQAVPQIPAPTQAMGAVR